MRSSPDRQDITPGALPRAMPKNGFHHHLGTPSSPSNVLGEWVSSHVLRRRDPRARDDPGQGTTRLINVAIKQAHANNCMSYGRDRCPDDRSDLPLDDLSKIDTLEIYKSCCVRGKWSIRVLFNDALLNRCCCKKICRKSAWWKLSISNGWFAIEIVGFYKFSTPDYFWFI